MRQEERDNSRRLYRELAEAYQQLELLAPGKEKAAALEERNRLAEEMHDALGRLLISLMLQISTGGKYRQAEQDKTGGNLNQNAAGAEEPDPRINLLTAREKELVKLVGGGKSNREIAGELFIAEGTVRNHISNILSKLELRDRTQLAIFALKNQLLGSLPGVKH